MKTIQQRLVEYQAKLEEGQQQQQALQEQFQQTVAACLQLEGAIAVCREMLLEQAKADPEAAAETAGTTAPE